MANAISSTQKTLYTLALFLVLALLTGCNDAPPVSQVSSEPDQAAIHTHEAEGETCFICDASKRVPDRLWCGEHSRYEDRCFICHPELEEKDRLFCNEHGLYEDECFLCHPEILQGTADEADTHSMLIVEESPRLFVNPIVRDAPERLYCNEHDVWENECGICHPELIKELPIGGGLKIRLSSSNAAKKAGVQTGFPNTGTVTMGIQALGELTYNKNKLAVVTPYASGVIESILVEVGQSVEKGQLMAEVNSPAIADAKSAFITSLVDVELRRRTFERVKGLVEKKMTSQRDLEDAHATYAASTNEVERTRQQLLNLGFTADEILKVESNRLTSSVLPLRSPFAGIIVQRDAVLGMAIDTGVPMFKVADLSTMWLELSVPEAAAVHLQTGAAVRAEFDAFPGESFDGQVTWIATEIDQSTRTVQVRASIPNPGLRLKSGQFGRALIMKEADVTAITVPKEALQFVDGTPVLFAKLDDQLYEARLVKTGPTANQLVSILEGITLFDEIVMVESYILKSELLKGRLGAGCVDE